MAIVLCRHGQTAFNATMVVQPADTPLDEVGLRQAERLAARLTAHRVTRLVSSDLSRARMTAAAIERALGVKAETTELLRERDFGDVRGTAYADLKEDIYGPDYVPPNGESWDVFHDRVARAWRLVADLACGLDGDLVVVSHGLLCRVLVARHLPLAPGLGPPERWDNTGVTLVDAAPPHTVRLLACTAHLDAAAADTPARGAV
jgi:probable phosphoglycerate mutase